VQDTTAPNTNDIPLWKRILDYKFDINNLSQEEQDKLKVIVSEITKDSIKTLFEDNLNQEFIQTFSNHIGALPRKRLEQLTHLIDQELRVRGYQEDQMRA
jgi:NhaP-type Na+/H+ and K+/H+ antiporter